MDKMTTENDAVTGHVLRCKTIKTNYTVLLDDYTIVAYGLTGDITMTLPFKYRQSIGNKPN